MLTAMDTAQALITSWKIQTYKTYLNRYRDSTIRISERVLDSGADGGAVAYREPGRAVKSTCPVGNTAAAPSSSKRKSAKSAGENCSRTQLFRTPEPLNHQIKR